MNYKYIDWNEIWKKQMLRHRRTNGGLDFADLWDDHSAAQYWKMVQETQKKRIDKTIKGISVNAKSRVLDIGSGPGVIAIPLAKKVTHITSIDPSEGMIGVLKEKMSEHAITNIRCVQKKWEEVDIKRDLDAPYDVVLASLSLGMFDIRSSIKKMLDAGSRYIYLYWFAGEPSWDYRSQNLLNLLHGRDFHPMPRCDVLFNVLYQMGIYPHIRSFPYMHLNVFSHIEEAIDYFSHRYRVSTDHQRSILGDYLQDILQEEEGCLVLRSPATCLKMWWEKQDMVEQPEVLEMVSLEKR